MIRSRNTTIVVLALLGAWFAFGCGGMRGAAQKNRNANDLKEVGLMYHNYIDMQNKPPSKVEDFQPLAGTYPNGYAGLQSGKYVVIYDVHVMKMPEGASNTVLGYESQTPTSGGLVLMGDGVVRSMTASEFQSAPKGTPAPAKPAPVTKTSSKAVK